MTAPAYFGGAVPIPSPGQTPTLIVQQKV
jgi:hypothetical protein